MGPCSSNIFTNLDQRSTVTDPKKISKDMRDTLRAKVTTLSSFFSKISFIILFGLNIFLTIFKEPKLILDISKFY